MNTTPLQVYFTGSSTTEAAASIFTPVKARISAIYLEAQISSTTAADVNVEAELSFQSTTQRTINDATGVLASISSGLIFTTSGHTNPTRSILINNIDIIWEQSQRVYLHTYSSTSITQFYKAIIYTNR